MDKQRFEECVELIEQLLACPQERESELLQANVDLVNPDLMIVMEKAAAHLESQGDSNAVWLRRFASNLVFRIAASEAVDNVKRFLLETLQLVAEHQGIREQIYPVWEQQQAQLNSELLVLMPTVVAELVAGNRGRRIFMAAVLNDFGNLIQDFPLGSRSLNMELGIVTYASALQIYTRDAFPEDWAMTQNNLANAYSRRILGDRAENTELAIATYELALEVRTHAEFVEQWAETQNNLGNAYNKRIRGDRAENIEQAIIRYELALKVLTRDTFPEQWATVQHSLANAYAGRIRGDRAENIEQAIAFYQLILKVLTYDTFPEQWARTHNNLADAYNSRIRGDRVENIEQAIASCELALQVRTRTALPDNWATTHNNLANALYGRIRGDRAENIERAIASYELALQVRTRIAFPEDWATTHNNLAVAYSDRIQGDPVENIERAIASYELALQVRTRIAFPEDWAMTHNNLATAYSDRIQGERADNLKLAISYCNLALQVRTRNASPVDWATTQNNLAAVYSDHFWGDRVENFELATAAYESALQVNTHDAFPNDCRRTSRNLGNLHFGQYHWDTATIAYTTALTAAETLYQSCILLDGKAAELAETADLPRRLAYALAQTGNLRKAIETLEQGRARGLTESLDRDRANLNQLQQLNPDLYNQYRNLTEQLRNLESQQRDRMTSNDRHSLTPEVLRETAIDLRQQLNNLIQDIHQVPSYEAFLKLPTLEDVRKAATSDRPLVYLTATPAGSLALIVTPEDIQSIWLDSLTEEFLRKLLIGSGDIENLNGGWFIDYFQASTNRQTWYDTIDSTTRQLWEPLMQPLTQHLKTHNIHQATLIPTGFLSLLPLHAAWTEDPSQPTGRHYAIDNIHFTYAPNAKSLIAAQKIADCIQPTTILAIDNPTQDLDNSEREINAAIDSFPDPIVLRHTEATVENVRSKLTEASIVHFVCHGTANLNDPLNSGLQMSDGLLTLREILALNLAEKGGIRLAILSACGTGLQGIENADEAISLPTGLLQAGVAGAIASLWSVSDLSTMLLLTKFYDFWREQHLPPDQALRQAQLWLRDTTNREKLAYFKSNSQNGNGLKISSENTEFLRNRIMDLERDDRSFAHPFHWAAFYYTGV